MKEKATIDRQSFRISIGVAITVIIFLIAMTFNFSTWKADMEAQHKEFDDRISHVGDKVVNMRLEIKELEGRASERDIELAKINTKLTNIEALLLDIKQDLKDHNG